MDISNKNYWVPGPSQSSIRLIDFRIDNKVATCVGTPHALVTPTTKRVITDAAHRSAWVLWTPGHISRMGGTVLLRATSTLLYGPPEKTGQLLLELLASPPTMGHSWSLNVLNKQQPTSPSISRNTQQFDTSVEGNFSDDRNYTPILSKVLGQELSDSLIADIYSRYWCTSQVTPSETRYQISCIWGSWPSTHQMNSRDLVPLLPE